MDLGRVVNCAQCPVPDHKGRQPALHAVMAVLMEQVKLIQADSRTCHSGRLERELKRIVRWIRPTAITRLNDVLKTQPYAAGPPLSSSDRKPATYKRDCAAYDVL